MFRHSFVDNDKGFALSAQAQKYYKATGAKTQVLPASLTSIEEVMALAGVDHITVSPPLLEQLSKTPVDAVSGIGSAFENVDAGEQYVDGRHLRIWSEANKIKDDSKHLTPEARYRLAFTRSKGGSSEAKLTSAINIFCDAQDKLEKMALPYLQDASMYRDGYRGMSTRGS